MSFFRILTFVVLVHGINCEINHPALADEIDLTFFFIILMISCIFRFILIKLNIPIPCEFFILSLGCIWGMISYKYEVAALAAQLSFINPFEIMYLYYPVLVFWITFCIDLPIFLKTLPQIMVIGILVAATGGFAYGFLMSLIIFEFSTNLLVGILGVFTTPIYPATVVHMLKKQSSKTKHIGILLEGECIISLTLAYILQNLYLGYRKGLIVSGHQVAAQLVKFAIMEPIAGLLFGVTARYLIRKMYTNRLCVSIFVFGIPFWCFLVTRQFITGFGGICLGIVGAMMSEERTALSKDVDNFLTDIWKTIAFVLDLVLTSIIGIILTSTITPRKYFHDYVKAFATYLLYYVVRFVSFLIFSPALSRMGYGMDLKNMIVCVWSGIKNPIILLMVRLHMAHDQGSRERNDDIYFNMTIIYLLSLLINVTFTPTILNFLGLRQISVARQINMNNCVKHIFTKRDRIIAILKMDRFLCDTNWSKVVEGTNIKHPYQLDLATENEDEFFMTYRYTFCPDCNKEIPKEPTNREFKEMQKEARMRVLKTKKMCYSRQYENGMMSREGIRILTQAVELAMDSSENVIHLEGLQKKFTEEDCFTRFIRNRVHNLHKTKGSSIKPPRRYIFRLCYNIVVNKTWEKVMLGIVTAHSAVVIFDIFDPPSGWRGESPEYNRHNVVHVVLVTLLGIFAHIYVVEFVMKIMAYSWFSIYHHGFGTYFKSIWNIIDFLTMLICYIHFVYASRDISFDTPPDENIREFRIALDILLAVRVLKLFRLIETFYPKLMTYLDRNVDLKMALTYEIGKSYASGETEILDVLPYMIDNKKIRDDIRKKIEKDRIVITKLLGLVQKEKPWIAITVKTKQAIRTILKSMNEAIKELKNSGWVDSCELEKLKDGMDQLYKKVNALKTVQPSAPKVIFKEVAWMAQDKAVIDFLFENVTVKKFEPGDIVFGEGKVADGIYIVVTGLFMITYVPDTNVLNALHEYGRLPIVDYLSGTKYEEDNVDFIVSGNCIGELSTLTGRSYNCVITADAHCQVYVLNSNILKRAMELSPDPLIGLECRIWKEVSVRIAVPLLLSVPTYQSLSQDQIKYTLERAFVPDLSNYKIFVVTEMIQDIILIEGVACDYNTRETFVAPLCIPRTVQKLILPTSSLMNISVDSLSKFLIIPEKEVDEYDVMIAAEENCEMISAPSATKCLQHTVQYRAKQRKHVKMKSNLARGKKKAVEHIESGRAQSESSEAAGKTYYENLYLDASSTILIDEGDKSFGRTSRKYKS